MGLVIKGDAGQGVHNSPSQYQMQLLPQYSDGPTAPSLWPRVGLKGYIVNLSGFVCGIVSVEVTQSCICSVK